MEREKNKHFSEDYRLQVVTDYYASGQSKGFIKRKYNLSHVSLLNYWIAKYAVDSKDLSLPSSMKEAQMNKNVDHRHEQDLEKRVHELEKALSYARLQNQALNVLIDVAEKNEGIQIRKKTGTKQ